MCLHCNSNAQVVQHGDSVFDAKRAPYGDVDAVTRQVQHALGTMLADAWPFGAEVCA
jgi:hypothetical protein